MQSVRCFPWPEQWPVRVVDHQTARRYQAPETFFPQLGLPIRGSNWIPKQPVGCPTLHAPRVPRGRGPPWVPRPSRAWFPVKNAKCQKHPKIQKNDFALPSCQKMLWHCLVVNNSPWRFLVVKNCFGIAQLTYQKCQMSNAKYQKCQMSTNVKHIKNVKCQMSRMFKMSNVKCPTCQKCQCQMSHVKI